MAAPWEQYQKAPQAAAPWLQYQQPTSEIPAPRRTGTAADQIPGYGGPVPAATAPAAPTAPASFTERLLAPLETGVALTTSAITAPIVEGAKILGTLTSGKYGTQAGIQAGEATGRRVQQFFQPALSPTAQAQTEAIGNALASTGIQGLPLNMMGDIATLARPAIQQVAPVVQAPIQARQQRVQAQRVKESELNAPRIDAARDAFEIGIALDPSISAPSAATRLKTAAVGSAGLQGNLSKINLPQVTKVAREDLGLPETTKLDAKAFELASNKPEITKPYDAMRAIPRVVADNETLSKIDDLRLIPTVADEGKAAAVNNILDSIKQELQAGIDGKTAVETIRQFKRDARAIYDQQTSGGNPSPIEIAKAEAKFGAAKLYESALENSTNDPKLLTNFRKARELSARVHDYERATNFATGVVDPQALARLAAEGKPLSGKLQKLANVAANFPEVMQGGVVREPTWREKLTRSSAGGTVGALVGSPFGLPGAIVGGGAGAAAGNVASALMARRMASPEYQRSVAMPRDYRPVPMGTTPGEVRYGPNALVPYNYAQDAFTPPNFVMMPERYGPQVTPVAPDLTRALPAPSAQGTMAGLRAEQQRAAGMSRTLGQQAEAQQAAAEAAGRRPASGEIILDINPLTGVPEISTGLRGATPATFQDFGASLKTAADKVTAGRMFDMTAAEKVAWNKTKVDLAEVAPGFKALTDKAIAAKMMDREWVAATAAKARQQAEALARRDALLTEQLANRDNLRLLARDIEAKQRELTKIKEESVRIRDLADMLDENMRGSRPDTSRKQQGRKTLDAKRNALAPDNQNKLAP